MDRQFLISSMHRLNRKPRRPRTERGSIARRKSQTEAETECFHSHSFLSPVLFCSHKIKRQNRDQAHSTAPQRLLKSHRTIQSLSVELQTCDIINQAIAETNPEDAFATSLWMVYFLKLKQELQRPLWLEHRPANCTSWWRIYNQQRCSLPSVGTQIQRYRSEFL